MVDDSVILTADVFVPLIIIVPSELTVAVEVVVPSFLRKFFAPPSTSFTSALSCAETSVQYI